jgi:4-amino-4-deoxy-L-arabinose transferase-like glycosyltransferase
MALSAIQTALNAALRAASGAALAALTFACAGGYGIRLIKTLWPGRKEPLEEILFSSALGYGLLSLLMALAGVFGGWTRPGAWVILSAGVALSWPFVKTLISLTPDRTFWRGPAAFLILLCALWAFLIALAPVTYYDSLVYHFALPAAYAQAGHWLGLKELIYSAFPQNLEMLWTFGLLLGHDGVANLISLLLTAMAVAAAASFAQRYLTQREGRFAALLLAAMPALLLLSSGGYVDGGLTLYAFLSFYALCVWRESGQRPTLILSGLFAGLAMGAKYTGGIPFAAGGILTLWTGRRQPAAAAKNTLVYGVSAVLTMSPWFIKNWVYVGNPFFPFFYAWGNPRLSPWVQQAAAGYFRGVAEYAPRSLGSLLQLPWDIAFRSVRFGRGMDILGDYGWAPFVFLTPCLFFCRKRPAIARILLAYAALFFIPWALSRPVLRFLLPLAPVLALLSAVAFGRDAVLEGSRPAPPDYAGDSWPVCFCSASGFSSTWKA